MALENLPTSFGLRRQLQFLEVKLDAKVGNWKSVNVTGAARLFSFQITLEVLKKKKKEKTFCKVHQFVIFSHVASVQAL